MQTPCGSTKYFSTEGGGGVHLFKAKLQPGGREQVEEGRTWEGVVTNPLAITRDGEKRDFNHLDPAYSIGSVTVRKRRNGVCCPTRSL